MTNMVDIKNAKRRFEEHTADHKCRAGQCDTRRTLWLEYMIMAEQWRDHDAGDEQAYR